MGTLSAHDQRQGIYHYYQVNNIFLIKEEKEKNVSFPEKNI